MLALLERTITKADPLEENWKQLYRLQHELDDLLDELRLEVRRLNNRPVRSWCQSGLNGFPEGFILQA
jgi:hypothetical protein